MWILVRRVWVWYVHTAQVCHSAVLSVVMHLRLAVSVVVLDL